MANKKLNIIYQGETLATLNVGDAKLLEVKDFKMEDDLVFEIVEDNLIRVLDNETTMYSFNVGSATKFSDLSFPLYSNEDSNVWLEASIGYLSIRGEMTNEIFSYVYFEEVTTSLDDVVPLSDNITYKHIYLSEMRHGGGSMD